MTKFNTEQEAFWAGDFGDDYIARNASTELLNSNKHFFAKALAKAEDVSSCLEFGANTGMNMRALQAVFPGQEQHAIEINAAAARELARVIPAQNVIVSSIHDFKPGRKFKLTFTKGVLIHINPDLLGETYDKLVAASERYVLVGEYYSPRPTAIPYRGHENRLFKRDFAGEILDRHPSLKLLDYGFAYHRDPEFPQDDINWFLLSK